MGKSRHPQASPEMMLQSFREPQINDNWQIVGWFSVPLSHLVFFHHHVQQAAIVARSILW
jgi:hypothetical protein